MFFTVFSNSFEIIGEESDLAQKLVQQSVPGATVRTMFRGQLSMRLPDDSSRDFPSLFRILDESKIVNSYGVSYTTLEEVFHN